MGGKQKADVAFLDFVSREFAGGVTVHVFESYVNSQGKRVYRDSSGKVQAAPNGKYIGSSGDIYIDLNAGDNGEGLVMNTFAHELYHHIEKWSPTKARQLSEFLVKELGLDSVEAMVEKQIKKATAAGHGVDYFMTQGMSRTEAENTVRHRAFSDFVADSLETVFTKGDALGMLQRLRKTDKGLVNRIKSFVNKWLSKLREFYKENPTISLEGHAASQLDKFEQIQELFMEALVDAGENFRNTDPMTAEKNTANEDGVMYQARENTDLPYSVYRKLINKKAINVLRKDWRKVAEARVEEYRELTDDQIPDIDFLEIAEYNKINTGFTYTIRNYSKDSFEIIGRNRIRNRFDGYVMEVVKDEGIDQRNNYRDVEKRSGSQIYPDGNRVLGNHRTSAENVGGSQEGTKDEQGNGIGISGADSGRRSVSEDVFSDRNPTATSNQDSEGNQLSKTQQEYFRDSQVRDKEGHLLVLYHQTDGDFTIFDTRHTGAGSNDSSTPFGIFLKRSAGDIGLSGKKQMALYANITNPLRVANREDLDRQLRKISGRYATISDRLKNLDVEYQRKIDQAQTAWNDYVKKWREANPNAKRTDLYGDPKFNELFDAEDDVVDEWTTASDRLSIQAKEVITEELRKAGHDGIFLEEDVGSWGRRTDTIIALDANQVKDVANENPTIDPDINFSDRNPTSTSNRSLLANALESTTQTDWEKKKLQEYKDKIQQIEEEEQKLKAAKQQIYEMSFAKGPRDAAYKAKLQKLRTEALHAEKRLNIMDQQLLRLEAVKPLQDLLKREKDKVKQRVEKKYKAEMETQKKNAAQEMANLREKYYRDRQKALADQRTKDSDKRKRMEMRKQIRKDIRDLTKMLNRGKDEQNVKEEMKDLAASTIAHGEVLFIDYYTDDDIIRNGVGPGLFLTSNLSALMNEAHDILKRLDNPPAVIHDDPTAWLQWDAEERYLKGRLDRLKSKLKEVFVAERNRIGNTMASDLMSSVFKAYEALANSDKEYIRNAYDYYVLEHLKGIKERFGNVKAKDMSLQQLEDLHKAYTMVITTIRNANKAFTESRSVEQLAKKMVSELKSGQKISKTKLMTMARNAADLMGWNYEKLYYALERVGSDTLTRLFNNLANSENIVMSDVFEAKEKQLDLIEKYGYNTWKINEQIDKDFVDNRGKKFRMTLGEMMLLYAYVRRGSVFKQLEVGGFVFGEKALVEKLKDTDAANSYKLTKAQCISITDTLTTEQKNFVADMQTYLSEVMGAKGNEVSMMMYGVELFGEPNYIPVHIAGEYMARAEESKAKSAAGFGSMANAGFTKSKNIEAKAPIVLESFMSVWVDHVNEMSRYHGTVPALEDIRRVMNYSVYNDANTDSVSVKAVLENSHGEKALNYFDSLYREANSGAVMDKLQGFSKQALSKMRKLGVAYSLSVVVQQPASLVRAYAMIDKKYFGNIRIPGLRGMGTLPVSVAKTVLNRWTKTQTKAYSEMMKYAPGVTLAKEIGGFDTASGSSIRTYLLDTDKSIKQKLKTGTATEKVGAIANMVDDNPVANIPNLADKMTWIEIWNACKRETADKYKTLTYGSKAFMEKVGERFTEVIRATQVYDSMFSKSPMLRSKNAAVQYMVSFMNEPNTVANMVESSIRDVRNGDVRNGLRKMTAVVRSIAFTCILKSVVYAMRDDDEDENYIEKYMEAVTGNLIGDFTGLNYIPVLSDIWSLVQGYDVQRPDISIFANVIKDVKKYLNVHNRDTSGMTAEELDEWERNCTESGWSVVGSVAGCFGIPAKNITREVKAVFNTVKTCANNAGDTTWKTIEDAVWQGVADELPWVDEEKSTDKLYRAIIDDDQVYLERLKKGYIDPDGNFKETAYTTAVRNGLRENDFRIQEAANARKSMDTEEYLQIVEEIADEGHFSEDDVVSAIRSEYNKLKGDDSHQQLYDAMVAGDDTAVEELKGNYINDEGKFSDTSYHNAIQRGLRENEPRIQKAAEAYHNGDKTTYLDILKEIADEDAFTRKDIKAAIMDVVDELEEDS